MAFSLLTCWSCYYVGFWRWLQILWSAAMSFNHCKWSLIRVKPWRPCKKTLAIQFNNSEYLCSIQDKKKSHALQTLIHRHKKRMGACKKKIYISDVLMKGRGSQCWIKLLFLSPARRLRKHHIRPDSVDNLFPPTQRSGSSIRPPLIHVGPKP